MEAQLPEQIRRLFWDMNARRLDLQAHKRTIVERILNCGTLSDWRWLRAIYGAHEIQQVLGSEPPLGRDGIRPESRLLASLIFK